MISDGPRPPSVRQGLCNCEGDVDWGADRAVKRVVDAQFDLAVNENATHACRAIAGGHAADDRSALRSTRCIADAPVASG